jgi:hypothetical protein
MATPDRAELSADEMDAFDEEQLLTLIAAVRTAPGGTAPDAVRVLFLNWARHAFLDGLLLHLVLSGRLAVVGFVANEPEWATMGRPTVMTRRRNGAGVRDPCDEESIARDSNEVTKSKEFLNDDVHRHRP